MDVQSDELCSEYLGGKSQIFFFHMVVECFCVISFGRELRFFVENCVGGCFLCSNFEKRDSSVAS